MHRPGPPEMVSGLLGEAAERSRLSMRERLGRLRSAWRTMVQAGLATVLAWTVAHEVIGHPRPFFAPIAAIVTLGVTLGQRTRRAVEVGVAVADLLVLLIGSGTWQLLVIVMLAMTAAILLGSGTLLVTQAAASAVLVVTLSPPDLTGISFSRSLDAAVGAATALVVSLLVLPIDIVRLIREAAEPVLAELEAALLRARAIDDDLGRFREAIDVGQEGGMTTIGRRTARRQIGFYATAGAQID